MGFFHSPKQILFQPQTDNVALLDEYPIPAFVPDWYKRLSRYINNSDKPIKSLGKLDLKTCAPYRDVMLTGYYMTLQSDIEVISYENGDIDIFHNNLGFSIVEKRGDIRNENSQGFGMPIPMGSNPLMCAWVATFGVSTPSGYSALVTHPLNRNDLPFLTTSGIIDSDVFGSFAGNIPFFFKEGFSGFIPKGTPIAQVIPVKREDWKSQKIDADEKEYKRFLLQRDSILMGYYQKYFRQAKNYE